MNLYFFNIGLYDKKTGKFAQVDGEVYCESFRGAKLIAHNLRQSVCNNSTAYELQLTGEPVVTRCLHQVD